MDWLKVISVAAALIGIAGILGAAAVVFISRTKDELIEAQDLRIKALKEEMLEKDQRCQEALARVNGRLDVLQSDFARELARLIVEHLPDARPWSGEERRRR